MKHIVIAGFDGALSTAITGIMDILSLTGVSWQRIMDETPRPAFKIWLASKDGSDIACINRLKIGAHLSFEQAMKNEDFIKSLTAIVVPTIGSPIEHTLGKNPELVHFLQWGHSQSLTIASNCTGNFFLAEAGLLDHRKATTHWGYESLFKARYPEVRLQADKLITVDENIFCAGGGLAWFDLCIYLIEQELGYDAALQTAKAFVIDYRRESQLSYGLSRMAARHQDNLVTDIQHYFEDHYQDGLPLDNIAANHNVSKRTLIRRFNAALGMTPHTYLQQIRIEVAQKLLAESTLSPEQIVQHVGYEDTSSFRRLFKQHTGLTLSAYRQRFAKRLS